MVLNCFLNLARPFRGLVHYDADNPWIYNARADSKNGKISDYSKDLLEKLGADDR